MRYPEGDDSEYSVLNIGRWERNLRATVRSAKGKKLLQDLKEALEAMPTKELIANSLVKTELVSYNFDDEYPVVIPTNSYCAMGALAAHKGVDVVDFANGDEEEYYMTDELAGALSINNTMAYAIATCNDEATNYKPGMNWKTTPKTTNADRWHYVYNRVCLALEKGVPLV
jgi:hypothetical protein